MLIPAVSVENGERVLAALQSPFNLVVVTEDDSGFRTLSFGHNGVPQSIVNMHDLEDLELPYSKVLPLCLAFIENPVRILIVGLGGGTLPSFFHRHLPGSMIEVVEIDDYVVQAAKLYFTFQEDARMQVHVEDGRDFIENCTARYDLIILDSFGAESIPPHLLTAEFLQATRNALTPGGIAVANVWGRSANPLYEHMLLTYRTVFEEVYILDVPEPGTKIFIALQQKELVTRADLLGKARRISLEHGFRYDLCACLAGFRNSDSEQLKGGRILSD
ncbi:MAG: Spermidine synthase [Chthoniobacteraceae bacterium]|nr:Spermidine synthase [Chthoniobacteraceae bacterium]